MEAHILALVYGILSRKGEEVLAKKIWRLRPLSVPSILAELSLLERKASTVGTRWIATAKLAIQGNPDKLRAIEREILSEMAFPDEEELTHGQAEDEGDQAAAPS